MIRQSWNGNPFVNQKCSSTDKGTPNLTIKKSFFTFLMGLRLFKSFFTFLNNTCPPHIRFNAGIYTYSPSPLGILSEYLYLTKSIFRPISGHWIITFYSSLKSLEQQEADCTILAKKFSMEFCTDVFTENLHIFSFLWIQIYFLKILYIRIRLLRMHNLLNFFDYFLLNNLILQ